MDICTTSIFVPPRFWVGGWLVKPLVPPRIQPAGWLLCTTVPLASPELYQDERCPKTTRINKMIQPATTRIANDNNWNL